ncbi:uncharacterized protein EURHEDRAFT_514049 [Aspergillus ruber CBS 135680]|uniref:Uncharacterized protein n=1 Tax=Aspergillus ruber (strain CBS 135680) TaxID=1388766 RepID=A0A017SJ67_ASPRC|nr:uncharacterized protein EURHEDRAFT_514049 [Aspergillus ruber CBS 135680]EYE96806.1 hypothetical protein EURHEDRAFT_514049 [Aspergillus ruber CBS 135680]
MESISYYYLFTKLPGFGEECREKYGFSDSCITGNWLVITGQSSIPEPLLSKYPPKIEEQIANNVNDLIIHTLVQEGHAIEENCSGWDHVVKLRAYFSRENMVHYIRKWCPHHQPLFTMVGIESLPFPEHLVEFKVDVR